MIKLFTYGSLMCSDIMFQVAGARMDSCPATLNNFFRSKLHEREYPAITPQPGATVAGVLYFDLSTNSRDRLDTFEGELYQRLEVEVITNDHGIVTAMTYAIKPSYNDLLTGTQWSFSHFLAEGKERFQKNYLGFQGI